MSACKEHRLRRQSKAAIAIQAARETGVLKEAKDKLEKRVEELTWRLQLEKRLRASLQSEEQRADESGRKLAEVQELSEERRKRLEDSDKKIQQLQESFQGLEDKCSNLESENQVFRQQAVSMAPNKFLSGHSKSILQGSESGHLEQAPLHLGFAGNRPVATCIIYKCLLRWRSFEVERTSIFDRIIQTIGHAIEKIQDNNDILAYWLSNASTLLLLLQRTLKASSAAGMAPQRRRSSLATLFGRMTHSFRGSPQGVSLAFVNGGMSGGAETLRQVEAKYPALLFKQQLTAYVEKIYGMIRDNLKKEISPLLGLCIQAPRTSRASLDKGSPHSVANTAAQQALIAHWQGIVKSLGNFLDTLQGNHVGALCSLLLRRECCSFSNGEYVKAGLAELETWCYKATDEVLTIQQLYRISTMYWDDKYGTRSVSPDVIGNMRVLMTEDSNNAVSNSFLLDDDSRLQNDQLMLFISSYLVH
ncbi:hypothetical protein Ancab_000955 [Ancistrocladus abbreviatus]